MRIENGVLKSLTYEEMQMEELTIPEGVLRIEWDFTQQECAEIESEFQRDFQSRIKTEFAEKDKKRIEELEKEETHSEWQWHEKWSELSVLKDPNRYLKMPLHLSKKCRDGYSVYYGENCLVPNNFTGESYHYLPALKVKKLKLPNSLQEIGAFCFSDWNLEQVVLPDNVNKVGNNAFAGCRKLKQITLSNSLTKIPNECFYGCEQLPHIIIPDSVTEIEDNAFSKCSNLQYVGLSASLTTIGKKAFDECNIDELVLPSSLEATESLFCKKRIVVLSKNIEKSPKLVVPEDGMIIGKTIPKNEKLSYNGILSTGWVRGVSSTNKIVVPSQLDKKTLVKARNYNLDHRNPEDIIVNPEIITQYECQGGSKTLRNNQIKNRGQIVKHKVSGYKEVGENAFADCPNLQAVIIDEGVTTIGRGAFAFCENLATVRLPSTLRQIHKDAFKGCIGISQIIIPEGVKLIGESAFQDCEQLTELKLPKGVTVVRENLAQNCNSLLNVELSSGTETIEDSAFDRTAIGGIELPKSLKRIGKNAFSRTKLSTVVIPKQATLEEESFAGCEELISVELNEGLTTIPKYCFMGCTNLPTIRIPSTVATMQERAFANCDSLNYVFYEGDGEMVERDVTCFEGCPASALSLNAQEENVEIIDGEEYTVSEPVKKNTLAGIKASIRKIRERNKER